MELRVNEVTLPEEITFNYEELKEELQAKMRVYETMLYTPETMKQAKADKAALNKLRKALNDERIRQEREYMRPFTEFKQRIAELVSAIDRPIALIDKQVKSYEEDVKAKKRDEISSMYMEDFKEMFPSWLEFDRIFDPRWLNSTYSMKAIRDDLAALADRILSDLTVISEMPFCFEANEVYKRTLDLQSAVSEGKRMEAVQKRKEEAQKLAEEEKRRRAEEAQAEAAREQAAAVDMPQESEEEAPAIPAEALEAEADPAQWISFKARLTFKQAVALREFLESNRIEFMAI